MTLEEKYKDKTLEEKKAALKQLKEEMPFMVPGMTEEELKSAEEKIRSNEAEIKYLNSSIKQAKKDAKKNKKNNINTNNAAFGSIAPETTTTIGNTTIGNTTTTGNTTTGNTATKESAWNNYNKQEGTAKGLFENFNTLEMTAEDARKEFLSKVSTPSDAAKKAFKETYGVDLVVDGSNGNSSDNGNGNSSGNDNDNGSKDDKNKKYKSSMYGIIDAMKNGDIDPSTGVYFMLDALSKAARNTGIDIGNIGAQFSGGTVRDDYQDSLWNQRRSKMFENEMTSEINKQKGTDKEMEYNLSKEDLIGKGLSNEQADLALNASRTFNNKAEEFRKAGNDTMADLYALVGSAATKDVGPEELAAIAASGILNTPEGKEAIDEIIDTMTGLVGSIGNTLGGINEVFSFFTNWKNKKK